ncbi:hypothetical protein MGLY_35620 (plasmid) [Neomoorella glycerini]|uniref:Uncharacterized protein n=1 Tax=Neomoorella glycerini TaxID=55779 RepID=A0A6I5ZXF6_9FIRM|nr:hypothetical protein [Moorella glycerini]QGP94137.1 hypothetical protein MGLY_35620 [Moorella glycerini]
MRKGILTLIIVAAFVIGAITGAGGMYYGKIVLPMRKAEAMARQQREEFDRMIRRGEVTGVKPGELTVKVEKSGDPAIVGRVITVQLDERTSYQEGMGFLNLMGEEIDATRYLKPGMKVDLLVKDGKALAVHWEKPKPGEQAAQQPPGQPGPGQETQEQGQKK